MYPPIDKLAYIYIRDNKILVAKSKWKDTWFLPGGKRDGYETDEAALIREVQEELSVDLITDTIRYYGSFEAQAHGKPVGTLVHMTCYTSDFTGILRASSEIEKIEFFDYSRKWETSLVNHLIFDDLHEKGLIK